MKKLLFLALFLLLPVSAQAQTQTCQGKTFTTASGADLYCSANWLATGNCDSTDQVFTVRFQGTTTPSSWQITPWESQPITIRGISLIKVAGGTALWFMAGNGYVPDAMAWLKPGETFGSHHFPAGMGMPFPSSVGAPSNAYLDLHGGCTGGGTFAIHYTVYYTVP